MPECKHLWVGIVTYETTLDHDEIPSWSYPPTDWYECHKCGIQTETPILETLSEAIEVLRHIW